MLWHRKGGYTKINFIIPKNTVWNLNVYYSIGKKGKNTGRGRGGGGSIIVLGHPNYVFSGTTVFEKDKVIAVIAGGGGACSYRTRAGHGGGGNACGTNTWSSYWYRYKPKRGGCNGVGGWPGGMSLPSNKVGLVPGGGSDITLSVPKRCSGYWDVECYAIAALLPYSVLLYPQQAQYGAGGSGYGGGGGSLSCGSTCGESEGGGGGAYCGFFGQPVGCSGITGYNNGDGWGKITLIPQ